MSSVFIGGRFRFRFPAGVQFFAETLDDGFSAHIEKEQYLKTKQESSDSPGEK